MPFFLLVHDENDTGRYSGRSEGSRVGNGVGFWAKGVIVEGVCFQIEIYVRGEEVIEESLMGDFQKQKTNKNQQKRNGSFEIEGNYNECPAPIRPKSDQIDPFLTQNET